MEKGILHLHLTVIVIFLLTFSFKTLLLLINNTILLEKVRSKTKILEMVTGTLILATGVYLLIITKNSQSYMVVKIVLVLAAIPLGIVGLKKSNKPLSLLSLLLFIYIFAIAQTRDLFLNIGREPVQSSDNTLPLQTDTLGISGNGGPNIIQENNAVSHENAKAIYNKACVSCHGPAGNLGAGGAKDLSKSKLSDEEKEQIISNGKGLMAPFKYSLSEQEIKQVVQYVNDFKK